MKNAPLSLPRHAARPAALAGLILLVGGCGLRTYEEKMLQTQKRLQRYEEESRLLDAELRIPAPAAQEKDATPPPAIFLRPPRGIQSTPSNEKEPRNRILYTFPPKGAGAAGVFHNVEVAVGDKSKGFDAEVLRGFSVSGEVKVAPRQFKPPGRDPVTFQSTEFDEGQATYSVNFWRGPEHQVAIIYSFQRGQKERAAKAIEASLGSFAVGKDVGLARQSLSNPLRVVPSK